MIKCIASKTISFNVNKMTKPCKLIAKTVIRSVNDLKDTYAFYEIPYANIISNFAHECINNTPSIFDVRFEINPDDDGELFKLHIV